MELLEASFFYGDYRDLLREIATLEEAENVDAAMTHEKFLSCDEPLTVS